jgi:transposase
MLEFLPPYSPDLNPIEESFAELKQWLKKHNMLVSEFADFGEFLELGVKSLRGRPANHFRSCHIQI